MFFLAVCSVLLTAGAALQCEVCSAINAVRCTGHYEQCKSPESRCMTTLTETSFGDAKGIMRSAVLEKSCGSVYNCTHPATLTTKEYRIRVTTKCCNTNFCNNATMALRPENSTVNGVMCESCFTKNSQVCNVKTPLNCTGDETNCVHYVASRERASRTEHSIPGSTITVAGCASESMQRSLGKAAFRGSHVRVNGMGNRNGADGLRHSQFLLPSLALIIILIMSQ